MVPFHSLWNKSVIIASTTLLANLRRFNEMFDYIFVCILHNFVNNSRLYKAIHSHGIRSSVAKLSYVIISEYYHGTLRLLFTTIKLQWRFTTFSFNYAAISWKIENLWCKVIKSSKKTKNQLENKATQRLIPTQHGILIRKIFVAVV